MTRVATTPWNCPNCNIGVGTPYCPACGEKALRPHDLTLRDLVAQMFEAFTNVDSKLLRSFRNLLTRPGVLTVAFLQGRRKQFLGPVSLFLIANVVFFAAESLTGSKVFTVPLDSHLHTQPWSEFVQPLVAERIAGMHTTMERYAVVFDRAVALKARSLIICMALFFALVPMLTFIRSRRPLVAHAVFSLHFYSFLLLIMCVAIAVEALPGWLGAADFASERLDYVVSSTLLLASAGYLYLASGPVYGARGFARILQTLTLTLGVGVIVLGYRFALLFITLYTAK